jgi:hypothetical protein
VAVQKQSKGEPKYHKNQMHGVLTHMYFLANRISISFLTSARLGTFFREDKGDILLQMVVRTSMTLLSLNEELNSIDVMVSLGLLNIGNVRKAIPEF